MSLPPLLLKTISVTKSKRVVPQRCPCQCGPSVLRDHEISSYRFELPGCAVNSQPNAAVEIEVGQ